MRGLLAAVSLLTRVPVGVSPQPGDLVRSVPWMPLVGAAVGLVVATLYAGAVEFLPVMAAATLAIVAGVAVTGALHEDGLADTFDGLGAGRGPEETLLVMREPTLGTFGTLAVVASLLLRVGALTALTPAAVLVVLPVIHALSRGGALAVLGVLPAAAPDGLGAAHSGPGLKPRAGVGVTMALGLGVLGLGWWGVVLALLAGIITAASGWLAWRRLGGYTGDVLGATEQLNEVALLLAAAALATTGRLDGAWWL